MNGSLSISFVDQNTHNPFQEEAVDCCTQKCFNPVEQNISSEVNSQSADQEIPSSTWKL
jgi:hypothetical protein